MGKKGGKKHLKRKPAPKFWPIHRKEFVWVVRPKPGPHPTSRCMPLALIVRDILGFAKTRKEAKTIISQGKIKVNGKLQLEELFPTGLMDVISIPEMKKTYRILPSEKGLFLHSIGSEEALFKLCRIENKTVIKGGRMQLNLHDGRNIQVQVEDPQKPEKDVYQTLDVLKTSVPSQEITAHLKLGKDMHAIIVGGKNVGKYGKIVTVEKRPGQKRRGSLVTIEDENGNRFQTTLNFIFATGDTRPWISLPEDN
ncbi:30S ribosomal protein S4e [Candidatus Bathyarchaeota archaeon]|nr:MAG: 30S ribosomal protein S4e [Candidatus Bathyarchaeota archaeon]